MASKSHTDEVYRTKRIPKNPIKFKLQHGTQFLCGGKNALQRDLIDNSKGFSILAPNEEF